VTATPTIPTDGAVIVRLRASDRSWIRELPVVPGSRTLTVTVGRADLLPVPVEELLARGYRLVGVAAEHRPIGPTVDVLVPAGLRESAPDWWAQLQPLAERVFDLRMGPVRAVLAAEIELHVRHGDR
jgi:hypothetical protein